MDTRKIGSLEVSLVGLGTNNFGFGMTEDAVGPVVDQAIDSGSPSSILRTLTATAKNGSARALGTRRDDVVIATKFGSPGARRPRVVPPRCTFAKRPSAACDASAPIGSTCTSCTDLTPPRRSARPWSPWTSRFARARCSRSGAPTFSADQLVEAEAAAADGAARFVSVQNQYNLLQREDESAAIPACERLGLAYLPFFPLASGLLTGKYARGQAPAEGTRLQRWGERASGMLNEHNFDLIDKLTSWSACTGRCCSIWPSPGWRQKTWSHR